jgi:hypothetical protein
MSSHGVAGMARPYHATFDSRQFEVQQLPIKLTREELCVSCSYSTIRTR